MSEALGVRMWFHCEAQVWHRGRTTRVRPLTQCQSLRPLPVRRALTSSRAEAAVHPAARPGHLMTLVRTSGWEAPQAEQSANTAQGPAFAIGMAHALYCVASPKGDQIIPRSTLQETLVADLPGASEPGSQEGVPAGAQDVNRALP